MIHYVDGSTMLAAELVLTCSCWMVQTVCGDLGLVQHSTGITVCDKVSNDSGICSGHNMEKIYRQCRLLAKQHEPLNLRTAKKDAQVKALQVVCPEAPDVAHAQKFTEGNFTGAVTTYICNHDYTSCPNKTTSVCQSSGKWGNLALQCRRKEWHMPPCARWDSSGFFLPCGPSTSVKATILLTLPGNRRNVITDVMKGNDIILHISLRMGEDRVVLDTRINGSWKGQTTRAVRLTPGKEKRVMAVLNVRNATVSIDESLRIDYQLQSISVEIERIRVSPCKSIQHVKFL